MVADTVMPHSSPIFGWVVGIIVGVSIFVLIVSFFCYHRCYSNKLTRNEKDLQMYEAYENPTDFYFRNESHCNETFISGSGITKPVCPDLFGKNDESIFSVAASRSNRNYSSGDKLYESSVL